MERMRMIDPPELFFLLQALWYSNVKVYFIIVIGGDILKVLNMKQLCSYTLL